MPESAMSLVKMSSEIVRAYVTGNKVPVTDLPALIASVHSALAKLGIEAEAPPALRVPAVSIWNTITDDKIICLEDGLGFRSLKRHLSAKYNMSPAEYRAKWDLPVDYPMMAPAYARSRSAIAKAMGIGRKAAATSARREKRTAPGKVRLQELRPARQRQYVQPDY